LLYRCRASNGTRAGAVVFKPVSPRVHVGRSPAQSSRDRGRKGEFCYSIGPRKSKGMARDPVCGMTVDEKTSKLKSEHEGRVFYFCSPGCKATFDRDPHKYGHPKG